MMAKMKIKPRPPQNKDFTRINELMTGDCFIADGELHILTDPDPETVNLATGERCHFLEGTEVIPVKCELTWTKILPK
jgi:hypothetical protein